MLLILGSALFTKKTLISFEEVNMRVFLLVIVCFTLTLTYSQPSEATTFGPFPDFKGFQNIAVPITIDTFLGVNLSIPFDGSIQIGVKDSRTFNVTVPVPIFAATYVNVTTTMADPFDPQTDDLLLTDVWAFDLNPTGDPNDILLTGFDPLDPEILPLSDEVFIGRSGTIYPTSLNVTSTIANLGALLPGYDLTAFTGNPDSIVYVSQGSMPASDAVVPEPSSFTLVVTGFVSMLGYGWRRRQHLVRSST